MSDTTPHLPDRCLKCGYRLGGLSPEDERIACPECGTEYCKHVPPMDWPLRCQRCRRELTGEPVAAGRVECPACGRVHWFPEIGSRRAVPVRVIIAALAILVIGLPLAGFVMTIIALFHLP